MEVRFGATVAGYPREIDGRHARHAHETFEARTDGGRTVRVVANLGFAPWRPVKPGDRVVVAGEAIGPRTGEPIVHWTHHDPAGRHAPGFIEWNGRRYA